MAGSQVHTPRSIGGIGVLGVLLVNWSCRSRQGIPIRSLLYIYAAGLAEQFLLGRTQFRTSQ